jgi:carbonic anhydrase
MIDAGEALARLKQGNARFIAGQINSEILASPARSSECFAGQKPSAIILACSDSSVPEEILFDQGLGDLFIIRVAGNAVTPSHIAAIEHAAETFGSLLVLVLGHSGCEAVGATLRELRQGSDGASAESSAATRAIRPAVADLLETKLAGDEQALMAAAVEANVLASVERLLHGSEVLESLSASGGLRIVGAHHDMACGKVSFFE